MEKVKVNAIAIMREAEQKNKEIFEILLINKIKEIPLYHKSTIKIHEINATLKGVKVVWTECGSVQKIARTYSYSEMAELTKEYNK